MVEKEQGKTGGATRGKSGNRKKAASQGTPKNAAPRASAKKAASRKKSAPRRSSGKSTPKRQVSAEERYRMIQEAAYLRAEREGFEVDPHKCWLAAEAEVDTLLAGSR